MLTVLVISRQGLFQNRCLASHTDAVLRSHFDPAKTKMKRSIEDYSNDHGNGMVKRFLGLLLVYRAEQIDEKITCILDEKQ